MASIGYLRARGGLAVIATARRKKMEQCVPKVTENVPGGTALDKAGGSADESIGNIVLAVHDVRLELESRERRNDLTRSAE